MIMASYKMKEDLFRHITAKEFISLDVDKYTIVDLREPDEVVTGRIGGSINIPFSVFYSELDRISKEKPVIVYCRTGEWSEEIADILTDRGYDVINLDGGYQAYRECMKIHEEAENKAQENRTETILIDARNLKCPGPVVKVADLLRKKPTGTKAIVKATEEAFYSDIRAWCECTGNHLDSINIENGIITAEITKGNFTESSFDITKHNEKTFIVFSGELDKTIAAFIMANGAAAMGRNVTMFFTFWGLNVLRKPEKTKVKKNLTERLFGLMMPKGTKELGLSRMNMGGMGADMIRSVMKNKGIRSLEELIDDAISHGVRLVACQMSMDIMGLRREELIDGIELGGVTTFLASCERADMSLFI